MMPSKTDLKTIYGSILGGHLKGFAPKVRERGGWLRWVCVCVDRMTHQE
jgi:hypothetical protein